MMIELTREELVTIGAAVMQQQERFRYLYERDKGTGNGSHWFQQLEHLKSCLEKIESALASE